MTHDLSDKFTTLTDDRPEPLDPAALVRTGITRSRRRRRTAAGVLVTAAATTVALGAAPVAGALLRTDAPASGPAATAQATSTMNQPATTDGSPVAKGEVEGQPWHVTVKKGGCLSFNDGNIRPAGAGKMNEDLWVQQGNDCLKRGVTMLSGIQETPKGPIVILGGTTSSTVRKVRITSGGRTFTAATVATPVSDKHRFFAVAYKADDVGPWTFVPIS